MNESSEVRPVGEVAKNRLEAEQNWLSLFENYQVPVHAFRLAAIYGPGRSAIERVISGNAQKIIKKGYFFSRIHVEDICGVLIKSMESPKSGSIYNVTDDLPVQNSDVLDYACNLLGKESLPEVSIESSEISERMRDFYRFNRKVSNKKIKTELNYSLKYPTYKEGLKTIYQSLSN